MHQLADGRAGWHLVGGLAHPVHGRAVVPGDLPAPPVAAPKPAVGPAHLDRARREVPVDPQALGERDGFPASPGHQHHHRSAPAPGHGRGFAQVNRMALTAKLTGRHPSAAPSAPRRSKNQQHQQTGGREHQDPGHQHHRHHQAAATQAKTKTRSADAVRCPAPPGQLTRRGTASPSAPRPGPCTRPRTGRCRGQAADPTPLAVRVKGAARSSGPAFGCP